MSRTEHANLFRGRARTNGTSTNFGVAMESVSVFTAAYRTITHKAFAVGALQMVQTISKLIMLGQGEPMPITTCTPIPRGKPWSPTVKRVRAASPRCICRMGNRCLRCFAVTTLIHSVMINAVTRIHRLRPTAAGDLHFKSNRLQQRLSY